MAKLRKTKKREFDDRTYPDVMVDLETLDTSTSSAIVSLGAIRFRLDTRDDEETIQDPERSLYVRMDTDDQLSKGRTASADTLEWWESQSDEARQVFKETPESPVRALKRFIKFCKGARRIWGNGNMFDNAIVRSACKTYGLTYPVDYWQDLDVRTLTRLWNLLVNPGSNKKRPQFNVGTEHNALDDARRQVLQCQQMFNELRGSKYNGKI